MDGLTPREALNLLAELQREIEGMERDDEEHGGGGGDERDFGGWGGCGGVPDFACCE